MQTDLLIAGRVSAFFALVLFGVLMVAWLNSQAMAMPVKYPCGFMPPS
jgi:hypothetical protein